LQGTGIVHLTGYNIQEEEGPSMFDDEDDYSSEDEAAEVEEIPALVNGKKRKAGASGDEATPATKKRNERKAAIEMAKKIANTIKVRLNLGFYLKEIVTAWTPRSEFSNRRLR
jgi:hypothetical protein